MKKIIVNEDGSIVETNMTKDEQEELSARHAEFLARKEKLQIEEEEKQMKRNAVLSKLLAFGINADDLKALGL